jgi:hypothetical protein
MRRIVFAAVIVGLCGLGFLEIFARTMQPANTPPVTADGAASAGP